MLTGGYFLDHIKLAVTKDCIAFGIVSTAVKTSCGDVLQVRKHSFVKFKSFSSKEDKKNKHNQSKNTATVFLLLAQVNY